MPLNYSFSQSFEKLADLWKSAEEKGDKKSEYNLALLYISSGKDALAEKAIILLKKSAKQRYTDAMYALGRCFENGQGVRKNYKSAADWYKKSADNLSFDLATATSDPEGEKARNHVKFIMQDEGRFRALTEDEPKLTNEGELLQNIVLAEQGDPKALNYIGLCYYYGQHFKQDRLRAVDYLCRSAAQGYEPAICKLAEYYYGEHNYKKSVIYYRAYAEMRIEYRHRRLGW